MSRALTSKYIQLLSEQKLEHNQRKDILKRFVEYAGNVLKLEGKYPRVILNNTEDFARTNRSFGHFNIAENKIVISGSNRNLADVLRTLAHELVHYKQKQNGSLKLDNASKDGADGSDIENEANSLAGIMLRKYGREHPEIYE